MKLKKKAYLVLTLIVLFLLTLSIWFNPLIFTSLKWMLIGVTALVCTGLYFSFAKKRHFNRAHKMMLVFALVIGVLNLWIIQSIDGILNPIQLETTQLNVFVLKENEHLTLTPTLKLGVSSEIEQATYESFVMHVENEHDFTLAPHITTFDNDLIERLFNRRTEAILIDVANLAFLSEDDVQQFLDNTRVIYSFEKSTVVVPREPLDGDIKSNALVFYISGVDSTGSLNLRQRSDVNQLAIVNPDTRTISLVSIPRDTLVPTTCLDNRSDKLSHAGVRGIECSIATLENYLNVPIDYFVRLNFTSFLSILDIIGEIQVYSHYTFSEKEHNFVKGMNTMDKDKALNFARARKGVPGGDQTRGLHQQEIIKGVFNRVTSPSQFANIQSIINSTRRFVQTDITSRTITQLLDLHVSSSTPWTIESHVLKGQVGWAPTPQNPSRQFSVVLHTPQQLDDYRQLIRQLRAIPD